MVAAALDGLKRPIYPHPGSGGVLPEARQVLRTGQLTGYLVVPTLFLMGHTTELIGERLPHRRRGSEDTAAEVLKLRASGVSRRPRGVAFQRWYTILGARRAMGGAIANPGWLGLRTAAVNQLTAHIQAAGLASRRGSYPGLRKRQGRAG